MPFVKAEGAVVKGKRVVIYTDEVGNKEIREGGSRSWRIYFFFMLKGLEK